jgi:hypothetical protein
LEASLEVASVCLVDQLAEPLLAESDAARLDHLALADVADAQEGPLKEGAPVAVAEWHLAERASVREQAQPDQCPAMCRSSLEGFLFARPLQKIRRVL